MDGRFDPQALRMAASVLVSDAGEPARDWAAMVDRLLQRQGQVIWQCGRLVMLESSSPRQAHTCRTVLHLVSGMMGFPRLFVLPVRQRRSLICLAGRRLERGFLAAVLAMPILALTLRLLTGPLSPVLYASAFLFVAGLTLISCRLQRSDIMRFNAVMAEGRAMLRAGGEAVREARQENRRHSETWAVLQEAERAFRHTAGRAEIYPLLAQYLRRLIPDYDTLSVWRLDEAGEDLELQYVEGRYADQTAQVGRLPRGVGANGHALRTRQPYVIADMRADERVVHPPGVDPSGSALVLPLFTTEGAIGTFMITRQAPGSFADCEIWGAELLAGVAALRLHALGVRDREQRLMEEFTRLHHLVSSCPAGSGVVDPLEQVGVSMLSAAQGDAGVVYRMAPGQQLTPCCTLGLCPEMAGRVMRLPPEASPASLANDMGVLSDLSRRDLAMWPEFGRFFSAVDAERCLVVPIQRADGHPIAGVVLVYRAGREGLLTPERLALCDTYARYAGATVHNLELYDTVMRQSGELRELLARVVDAQERERSRIALDLHDWLVQGLAAPSFAVQAAERLLDRSPAGARAELQMALQQLNQAADEMRRIMKGLRPHLLDELGLAEAVKAYAIEFSRTHSIDCRVMNQMVAGPAKSSQECLVAFRIIQEALNNVAKHAGAATVRVSLLARDGTLEIAVEDDGRGFDPRQRPASSHFGILGMRERAALMGGQVTISSLPGRGTRVQIQIPLLRGAAMVSS